MKKTLMYLLILGAFLLALGRLETGRQDQGRQQLEEALRRTAVTCFAAEGAYPPSVAYMEQVYGLQYDKERFVVRYESFASNLMPQIIVLEVEP